MSDTGTISVREATLDDLDKVMSILGEASEWLQRRGIDQWRPSSFPHERVKRSINNHEVYLAYLGDEPVATFHLQWADRLLWGHMDKDAGYVHHVAVRRAHAGKGLGRQILTWAESQVRSRGGRFLRLDCNADNENLCAYYDRHGFQRVGHVYVGEMTVQLFERPVA